MKYNMKLEELRLKFNHVYSSNEDDLNEHTKYLLIFLKNDSITKFIIKTLTEDPYYKEWEPVESTCSRGYEDYNLPDDEKSIAALSLYLLEKLVNEPRLLFSRHHNNLKKDELMKTIKNLFVKKLEDYIYLKIKYCNDMLYLLNKYKYQCEWFTREKLIENYNEDSKSGEYNLTKDLRKFLFDNGIEYPFSDPNSPSGKIDLIYGLDSVNPLTLEIKIFGGKNRYGKNYIKKGFNQAIKYAEDYNQEVSYLFIYNLSDKILEIESDELENNIPSISYVNKIVYIIVTNLYPYKSASKTKEIKTETITKNDLI